MNSRDDDSDTEVSRPAAARPDWLATRLRGRIGAAARDAAPRKRRRPLATVRRAMNGEGLLSRLLGQHASPELLALWLVEVAMCALLFYLLLSAGAADDGVPAAAVQLRAINQAAALALTFGLTSAAVGLYSPDTYLKTRGLLINTAVGALLASPAIWLVGRGIGLDVSGLSAGHPQLALKALLGWTLFLFALRMTFSYALRANLFVRRVLIVGDDEGVGRMSTAIKTVRSGFLEVAGVLPPDDIAALTPRHLRQHKVWAVIVTAQACDTLPARQILRAKEQGLRLYSDTEFWERQLRRIDINQPGPDWRQSDWQQSEGLQSEGLAATGGEGNGSLSGAAYGKVNWFDAAVHRLADIVLSLAMLVATLPLMLVTAIAIACESRGPVLYRQERVGLNGRVFTLMKFRSMRQDAEASGPIWAMQSDPRVTRIGAFIRLTRIDELPQLINVLKGEMSFIGPRPERPHFVAQLEEVVPFYRDRLLAKPGLTGWAQVNYPYGASVEDARAKLSYDLYYVKHRSLLLDLMILLATVRVVLFQRGAR